MGGLSSLSWDKNFREGAFEGAQKKELIVKLSFSTIDDFNHQIGSR